LVNQRQRISVPSSALAQKSLVSTSVAAGLRLLKSSKKKPTCARRLSTSPTWNDVSDSTSLSVCCVDVLVVPEVAPFQTALPPPQRSLGLSCTACCMFSVEGSGDSTGPQRAGRLLSGSLTLEVVWRSTEEVGVLRYIVLDRYFGLTGTSDAGV